MARAAEAESQEGRSRTGADEDSLRMVETEIVGAPEDRGAVRGALGDKGEEEGEEGRVLEEMPGPVCQLVRRSRGWRHTPPVSRPAGQDAERERLGDNQ